MIANLKRYAMRDINLKPMAQQKLYTEEQVRKLLKYLTLSSPSVDGYMDRLTPIELPSDEEINKKAYDWCRVEHDENGFIRAGDDYDIKELPSFIGGAKWLKDEILNQNK